MGVQRTRGRPVTSRLCPVTGGAILHESPAADFQRIFFFRKDRTCGN
jgi:hypothetical protein